MNETPNVLLHLNDLRITWRKQNFQFTLSQQEEYNLLLSTRQQRVKEFYEQGRVAKTKPKSITEY